jgi:oligopeptide/dipeptide ABC transporter ATP-binding protein
MSTATIAARRPAVLRRPVVRAFLGAPGGITALVAIACITLLAVLGPILFDERAAASDHLAAYAPASWEHPLGTDALGRDVLARVLVASRLSVGLGLASAAIAIGVGVAFGIGASVARGFMRGVLLRSIDTLLAFPVILMAIFVGTIAGVGQTGVVIGVGLALSFPIARLTSTLAMSVGGREYVNAARVTAVGSRRLLLRYVLPNIAEPLVITFSIVISTSILFISALSFLGLGVQLPAYDWGRLLTEGVKAIYLAPAGALGPAAAIAATALAFGFAGEALARAFNPLLWTGGGRRNPPRAVSPAGATVVAEPAHAGTANHGRRTPALEVHDLVVTFAGQHGPVQVVKGISFAVQPGEAVGVVGESGSGKTMTALAIAQLTPFPGEVSGTVRLHGEDLGSLAPQDLSALLAHELALVFQDPSSALNPALKIGAQMTLAPRVHRRLKYRDAWELAAKQLQEVHIGAPERQLLRYPHELSGGMRQRVMIGKGLMADPSVLIADEPTTALDVTVQAQIMRVLEEINTTRRNTAILLISHNLALVSQSCSRALVMYAGRIVEDLNVDQLRSDPKHPYTRALLASVPQVGHRRDRPFGSIGGESPDVAAPPPGCAFHPRCPLAVARCRVDVPPLVTRAEEDGRRLACHVVNGEVA